MKAMTTFVVKYFGNGKTETEEVTADSYVPLPQKVANFYHETEHSKKLIASFFEVQSVTVKSRV